MVAANRLEDTWNDPGGHSTEDDPRLNSPGSSQTERNASSALDDLDDPQRARLTDLLDQYLQGLETGQRPDIAELLSGNEDLQKVFLAYLEKLESLYGVAVRSEGTSVGSTLTVPQQLGEFQMIRPIGRGGMGIVYEALQSSIGRRVALKILPWDRSIDDLQVARFQNEARSAGLLDHPNIVPIFGVGTDQGMHYFAMQFIDGVSLDELLHARLGSADEHTEDGNAKDRRSADLSYQTHDRVARSRQSLGDWKQCVGWVISIAEALHHAHSQGVIHRDIKPSNLILDHAGRIWVTDFGLARSAKNGSLTTSGDMLGTMRYMSPEQASGRSALVDGRCDIYSLAATLYEILTLHPVVDAESTVEILQQINDHQFVPLRKRRSDLPRDLESVINKALSYRRDERYDTAEEFAEELRRVIDGRPTKARPPTTFDLVAKFASKHRKTACVMFLIGAIATVGLSIATITFASLKESEATFAMKAKQKEHLARAVVDRLGSQTAELLADIPAAEPVRRRLLTETLSYYEQLVAESRTDPTLRFDQAITLRKIGRLQMELGQFSPSIESLTQSERLMQTLVRKSPGNSMRLQWSMTQNDLGEALFASNELELAASYYTRAIRTQRELVSEMDSTETRKNLAMTLNNLGILLARCDADEDAQASYQDALSTIQSIDSCDLQRASIRRNLCSLIIDHSPGRAVELAKQALLTQSSVLERDPANSRLAAEVVVSLDKLGAALLKARQTQQARNAFDQGIEIAEKLLQRAPEDSRTLRSLLAIWNHLGTTSAADGDFGNAIQEFEQGRKYGARLKRLFPQHAETLSTFANPQNNLGAAYQRQGDHPQAVESFRNAVKHQSRAVRLAPERNDFRLLLDKQQTHLRYSEEQLSGRRPVSRIRGALG